MPPRTKAAAPAARTAKVLVPPVVIDPLVAKLSLYNQQLSDGIITADECIALRAKALGVSVKASAHGPVAVDGSSVATHTIEDGASKQRREILAQQALMTGSKTAPFVGGDLYDALKEGTGDDTLRVNLVRICNSDRLRRELNRVFMAAGRGVVPVELTGVGPATQIARLAAREWLRKLSSQFGAAAIIRATPERSTERNQLVDSLWQLFDDEESAHTATVLLSGIKALKADKTSKRGREDEAPVASAALQEEGRHPDGRGRGGGGVGFRGGQGRGGQGRGGRGSFGRGGGGRGGALSAIICGKCHGNGHMYRDCPS